MQWPILLGTQVQLPGVGKILSAQILTMAARLQPGTWISYRRCILEILKFLLETKKVIFPILTFQTARAFTYFLQYLKDKGYSCGHIRTYRPAVIAFHRCIPA